MVGKSHLSNCYKRNLIANITHLNHHTKKMINKEKSDNLKIGKWNWMCWTVHSNMYAQPKVYSFINYDKDVNPNVF